MQTTSLTRLLQDHSLRDTLDGVIDFPIKRSGAKLVTAATPNAGIDFGAVGTAYDYWLRFVIARVNGDADNVIHSSQAFTYYQMRYQGVPSVRKKMEQHLRTLKRDLKQKLNTGKEILKACLFLAKFDAEYKSGRQIEEFELMAHNVTELKKIIDASNLEWLKKTPVVTAPNFACSGTALTINAEGDLIVKETLVDVKTSSRLALKEDFRQLVGYFILNSIAGYPYKFESIGVYYPRFNYFVEKPLAEIVSPTSVSILTRLFRSKLGKNIKHAPAAIIETGLDEHQLETRLADDKGGSLLHWAAHECDIGRVSQLLSKGADVNAVDAEGLTPLWYALNTKEPGLVEFLIRSGADVNVSNSKRASPLMWAVINRNFALTKLLLNAGAEVNWQDDQGWTSLHYAVMTKHKRIIRLLIERRADINIRENEGDTPLSIALDDPDDQLAALLRGHTN